MIHTPIIEARPMAQRPAPTPPKEPLPSEADLAAALNTERLLNWNLTHLMVMEANGMDRAASALVDKIAAGLARRPRLSVVETRGRTDLPTSERGRSQADIAMLDRINARLTRGYKSRYGKTADQQREDDLKLRDNLERLAAHRDEAKALLERERETTALAQGRGEAVESDSQGVKRIIDRDPILSLTRAGVLNEGQVEVAQAIRDLYEIRQADAASAPFDGMPGAAHDHERFVASRFLRAKASVPIGQLETAILNGHYLNRDGVIYVLSTWPDLIGAGMDPRLSLEVMRDVCCHGKTLTSLGRGRAYERNKTALVFALAVADEVLDSRVSGKVGS